MIFTWKDLEVNYRDIPGFDVSYEESKDLCCESSAENFSYL